MEGVRLLLIRHGEVAANADLRLIGRQDEPLTVAGTRQAQQLARALRALPVSRVLCSPLRRALETAGPIAAARELPVDADERLIEQSFGRWEGLSRDEILGLGQGEEGKLERWASDPDFAPPGGEAWSSVRRRVTELVAHLVQRHPSGWLVLVSHVGPIKALLGSALNLRFSAVQRLFLDPGTLTVLDWGDRPLLRLFNAPAQLPWDPGLWARG